MTAVLTIAFFYLDEVQRKTEPKLDRESDVYSQLNARK